MVVRLGRAAALLLVVPFLTFASGLVSAHVHEPAPGHGHDHAVAHSHFTPHHLRAHHHEAAQDLENSVEQVVWLDSAILNEIVRHIDPVLVVIAMDDDPVDVQPSWSVTPFDDASPVHGPPRPASPFRGPPPAV